MLAYGLLKASDPETTASFAAIGLGIAGGLGGGGGATGRVTRKVLDWGAQEKRRFRRLPRTLLAVVTDQEVKVYAWSAAGVGELAESWPSGSFSVDVRRGWGELTVKVAFGQGDMALLICRKGILRRSCPGLVAAMEKLAKRA